MAVVKWRPRTLNLTDAARAPVIFRFTRSVVMTYLQDMGFHDGNGRDRLRTLMLMQEQGEESVASAARYLELAVDDRLELWTRIIDADAERYLHSYLVAAARC